MSIKILRVGKIEKIDKCVFQNKHNNENEKKEQDFSQILEEKMKQLNKKEKK